MKKHFFFQNPIVKWFPRAPRRGGYATKKYISHHCGRQNHRIFTPFGQDGPSEMPNKCITTNPPLHQNFGGGWPSIFKKTHPRNGGKKIFDRSNFGTGYGSYVCLAATIWKFAICTIYDTFFNFFLVSKNKKKIGVKNYWKSSKIGQHGPKHMPNQCITTPGRNDPLKKFPTPNFSKVPYTGPFT